MMVQIHLWSDGQFIVSKVIEVNKAFKAAKIDGLTSLRWS